MASSCTTSTVPASRTLCWFGFLLPPFCDEILERDESTCCGLNRSTERPRHAEVWYAEVCRGLGDTPTHERARARQRAHATALFAPALLVNPLKHQTNKECHAAMPKIFKLSLLALASIAINAHVVRLHARNLRWWGVRSSVLSRAVIRPTCD